MAKRTRWQPPHPAKDIGVPARRVQPKPKFLRSRDAMPEPERLLPTSVEARTIDHILERVMWCIWPGCEKIKCHELMVCDAHRQVIATYQDPYSRAIQRRMEESQRKREENAAAVNRGEKIDKHARTGGYVYFVRIDDLIKIGYSTQPYQRLRAYPPNAEVLGVFPGTKELEADLHGRFRFALKKGREWFRVADEITEYVNEMVAHYGPPDKAFTDRYQDPGPRQTVGTRNWRGTKKTAA